MSGLFLCDRYEFKAQFANKDFDPLPEFRGDIFQDTFVFLFFTGHYISATSNDQSVVLLPLSLLQPGLRWIELLSPRMSFRP